MVNYTIDDLLGYKNLNISNKFDDVWQDLEDNLVYAILEDRDSPNAMARFFRTEAELVDAIVRSGKVYTGYRMTRHWGLRHTFVDSDDADAPDDDRQNYAANGNISEENVARLRQLRGN